MKLHSCHILTSCHSTQSKFDTEEWTYHINHSTNHENNPVDVRATCGYYYPDGGSSDDYVYVECDAEHWHEDAVNGGDYFCDSQCA